MSMRQRKPFARYKALRAKELGLDRPRVINPLRLRVGKKIEDGGRVISLESGVEDYPVVVEFGGRIEVANYNLVTINNVQLYIL